MKKPARFLKYIFLFLAVIAASLLIFFYGYDKGAHDIFVDEMGSDMDSLSAEASIWDHGITWFEIPVNDMERARDFYEQLLDTNLIVMRDSASNTEMAFLPPQAEGVVSGSLVKSKDLFPSEKGVLIYFNCNPNLQIYLQRAINAGATLIQPKTLISEEIGYMAIVSDSEGNRIALHSTE